MNLWAHCQQSLRIRGFQADSYQANAALALQVVADKLLAVRTESRQGLWQSLCRLIAGQQIEKTTGLYLWGGVGRGKTWLMDCFFETLPLENKLREHFHSFMQRIHGSLRQVSASEDPLLLIAENLSEDIQVLCLDEFQVSDITDAMLLGRLLEAMFARGITLVVTSNSAPDELYLGGLQRDRFLPAIASLKKHCRVLEIGGETDFRLRALQNAEIYHCPLNARANRKLQECFDVLSAGCLQHGNHLLVLGRAIDIINMAKDVVWFEFTALCRTPRAVSDYIDIARRFNTVLLADVPRMDDSDNDAAQRFIHLIDEFYDRNVNLILSAASIPSELYHGSRLVEPFKRTRSRLEEMQSRDYLSRVHLA